MHTKTQYLRLHANGGAHRGARALRLRLGGGRATQRGHAHVGAIQRLLRRGEAAAGGGDLGARGADAARELGDLVRALLRPIVR